MDKKAILDLDSVYVSGPYNVVRLEGPNNKTIYLFFDIHFDLKKQTECSNIGSTDFAEFFVKTFKQMPTTNVMYDFFLEVYPTRIDKLEINKLDGIYVDSTARYIDKVTRLFLKLFLRKKGSDKVEISNIFKNLRLHYFDIRDYYENIIAYDINPVKRILETQKRISKKINLTSENKFDIERHFLSIAKNLNIITSILRDPTKPIKTSSVISTTFNTRNVIVEDIVNRLAYKMKHNYKHPDVKRIITKVFDSAITDLENLIPMFNAYVEKMKNNELTKPISEFNNIYNSFQAAYGALIDTFFLRRFLDKDYITNSIVYAGGNHIMMYIHILVKYFKFKITHIANNRNNYSTEKIHQLITSATHFEEFEKIFGDDSDQEFPQCSRLDSFPKNFM
jgi:hypothetical protein